MRKFNRLSEDLKKRICNTCGNYYFKPKDWSNNAWLNSKYCKQDCRDKNRDYQLKRAESLSKSLKGRKLSKEWRESLSKSRMGIKFSEKHRENIGKSKQGTTAWNKGQKGLQQAWNKGLPTPWATGENNSQWKGGITPINKAIRESIEYEEWRKYCMERDNFTCVECGIIGGRLEVDHIKPFSLYPDLRLELSNGRTLCKPCHKKIGWNKFREDNPRKKIVEI